MVWSHLNDQRWDTDSERRATKYGVENNKKGNRYEDAFAVFRLVQLAPRVTHDGVTVTVREQAACPVDDFVFREGRISHYYQLKNDLAITWGSDDGKLRKEFVAQKQQCEGREEEFTLAVVVSHDHRKSSLDRNVPAELKGVIAVIHLPAVKRPSEQARHPALREPLGRLSASRHPREELLRGIVEGFHLAWAESEPDACGARALASMIEFLWERPHHRVRCPLPDPIHPMWELFREVLARIPGLEWHVEGGYFELFLPPREAGLFVVTCAGETFYRFVDRVLNARPSSFEDFERLLP